MNLNRNINKSLALTSAAFMLAAPSAIHAGLWSARTPMPAPRSQPAGEVINGIFYVAGGWNGTDTNTLYAYNPAKDAWTNLASMPAGRYQGDGAGVISNKLYVPGGWTTSPGLPNNNLWVYDPAGNAWAAKANMPTLSACGASAVISNKLYVTTPCNGFSGYQSYLHVYDPASDTWTALANSAIAQSQPAAGVINGKFYIAGGVNDAGITNLLEVYDPASNSWTIKAPMPTARFACVGAVVNGKLYVIDGNNGAGSNFNLVEVYDPNSNTWSTDHPAPTMRSGCAAGVINGIVYLAGGSTTNSVATLEAFTVSPPPIFQSAAYWGSASDQRGTGIKYFGGALYICGNNAASSGIMARYNTPLPSAASPLWSTNWPSSNPSDQFNGVTATPSGVYIAGPNYTLTTDTVGGKEDKGLVAKLPFSGLTGTGYLGCTWYQQTPPPPGAFSYGGGEGLDAITTAIESGTNYIYTTGSSQSGFSNGGRLYVSKLGEDSTILWTQTDGAEQVGVDYSSGIVIATLNGNLYVAGILANHPYLRKYNSSGTLLWTHTNAITGVYYGLAALGNYLYAVGASGTAPNTDFLIDQWDENGNNLFSRTYDRNSAEDRLNGAVALGSRLFAAGYTRGNTDGGADAVLLEIDPSNGNLLSTTLYGGNQDDLANGVETDGSDLYVVGETRSFGNGSDQVMLLRYVLQPVQMTNILVSPANAAIGLGTNLQFTATGTFSDGSSRMLTSGGNSWTSGTPIPSASYGLGGAFLNGKFNAISGFATTRVAAYDPVSNTWSTTNASLPQLLQYFGTAVAGGKIYVVGGDTGGGGDRATLYSYDGIASSWTTLAPMPLGPRYGLGAAAVNGKIYAIGGYDSTGGYLTRVEAYDTVSNIWTTRASMPSAHYGALVGAINGKVYVAGGSDSSGPISVTHIYDPATDSWTTGSPAPFASGGNGTVLGGKLFSIGAVEGQQGTYAYDPSSDSWSTNFTLMPTARHDLGVAADDVTHRIFAVGGWNGNYVSALEIFTTPGDITWSSSNPAIAGISTTGLAAGLSNGVTTISAASGAIIGSTTLTVVVSPTISAQPMNATAEPGGCVTFSVSASGGALSYQWRLNGTNIVGATNATLMQCNITTAQSGAYSVVVSNVAGTTNSSAATLSFLSLNTYAGLIIVGKVGGNYEIDYRTNLNSGSWTTLTNILLPSSPYLFIDTNQPANTGQRFYRALLLP
jgi:N-acetylneuraminic acid mutarotase